MTAETDQVIRQFMSKHSGPLSIEQIAVGVERSIDNSVSLLDGATAVAKLSNFGTALFCSLASIEECGKASVLHRMAQLPKNNGGLWKDAWQSFRSHQWKSSIGLTQAYPDELRNSKSSFLETTVTQYRLSPVAERLRQTGLYVDFVGATDEWLTPNDVPQTEFVRWAEKARLAVDRMQFLRDHGLFSTAALQIQHEVYAPLHRTRKRRKDMTSSEASDLVDQSTEYHQVFFERLVAENIISQEMLDEIAQFETEP